MRWLLILVAVGLVGSAALTWRMTGSALVVVLYVVPCLLCLALAGVRPVTGDA